MEKSELKKGEIYYGEVDRVSSSNNAIIELEGEPHNHINLGYLKGDVVDKRVKFKYTGGIGGECLEDEYTPDSDGDASNDITDPNPSNKNKLLNGNL